MPRPAGTCNTTPALQELICTRASLGIPLHQIADDVLHPLQTIQDIVKRGKERGHPIDNPRSGRPSKINDQALRHLNPHVLHNRCQTLQEITNSINPALPAPVAPRTVLRAMQTQLNLSSHIASKNHFLLPNTILQGGSGHANIWGGSWRTGRGSSGLMRHQWRLGRILDNL